VSPSLRRDGRTSRPNLRRQRTTWGRTGHAGNLDDWSSTQYPLRDEARRPTNLRSKMPEGLLAPAGSSRKPTVRFRAIRSKEAPYGRAPPGLTLVFVWLRPSAPIQKRDESLHDAYDAEGSLRLRFAELPYGIEPAAAALSEASQSDPERTFMGLPCDVRAGSRGP
jgi:hypothetical protein